MDYYYHELEDLQKDFHDTLHDYPIFQETLDKIYDEDIKEINDLLDKNDEYYLKKALDKLKRLIDYVKDTSLSIKKEYALFDKYAKEWEKKTLKNTDEKEIKLINNKVNKANELIKSHDINDIRDANKIMKDLLRD